MGSCRLASAVSTQFSAQGAVFAQASKEQLVRKRMVGRLILLLAAALAIQAADLRQKKWTDRVRRSAGNCPAFEPFRCPEENRCISIQYLCDGAPDCSDAYDENPRLCTAARRPPVEETSSFLKSLLASHGPNYLEKLFGPKARNNLHDLGGVDKVAIALSESQTIEDFGRELRLQRADVEHLRSVFMAVENGDIGMLKSLGIKDSELGDVKFFLEKLVNTGFLD